jgi:putative transposase
MLQKNLYKNKYRNDTIRLPHWDYGSNAIYFITICTNNHINYFGEIMNNKIIYSSIGKITYQCWIDIPKHFPFVKLDKFIIMPNHVHGVLNIDKSVNGGNDKLNFKTPQTVGTQNFASLPVRQNKPYIYAPNKFGPQSKTLHQ